MKSILFTFVFALSFSLHAQYVADFESVSLSPDSHMDGSDGDTLISEEGFLFPIIWDDAWGFWAGGWAASNKSDSSRRGTKGLFQSITESGFDSDNYLIGQQGSEVALESSATTPLAGLYITNTSYAYHSIKEGDQFSKKFGGITGTDPDFFVIHILAKENGSWKPDTVHFYLADYRDADPSKDYVIDAWTWVDLSPLGSVDTLLFMMESSDTGAFGMNTPGFFAIDDISRDWHTSLKPKANSSLSLYPNPAGNMIHLNESADWVLLNMQGKTLLEGSGENIDIRSLPSGVYLLRDQQGRSTKFVKK